MTLEVHLVVPGPITRISGGTIYDRRIMQGLEQLGHRVVVHELDGTYPLAGEDEREAAEASLAAMEPADRIVIDGLALPAFEHCLGRLPARWVALVHHPLALEGWPEATAAMLEGRERRMLHAAGRVIVTGRRTAGDVERLGVPRNRVGVVEPGTERRPLAPADGNPPTLLTVGALIPRKGHDLLLSALAGLLDLAWGLVLIGPRGRDLEYEQRVMTLTDDTEVRERVHFEGEVDAGRLAQAYAEADLFVLPSHHEGYGMALAEAIARGLPVVSTRAGAIPDTVPEGCGVLVPPGDLAGLREALRELIADRAARLHLRDGARAARQRLPRWPDQARAFADQLMALEG